MIRNVAVIHISEAEAARDLPALLAKVRAGEEVRIDSGFDSFAVVSRKSNEATKPRLASEILAALERGGSTATLDPGFADDVEAGIRSHQHERLGDIWESF
jgi:hypothetical protein